MAAARTLLRGIDDPDVAAGIRQTLLQRLVGKNVKLALEMFDEMPPGRAQTEGWRTFARAALFDHLPSAATTS